MYREIMPPHKLGILGGGQLGRMFTIAAKTIINQVEKRNVEKDGFPVTINCSTLYPKRREMS